MQSAEAFSIRSACQVAANLGLRNILICGDSKSVIYLASSDLDLPWDIAALVADIRKLAAC